jgi:hypothetical protein
MSALYPSFKQAMLEGGFDLETVNVRLQLLDASYTFDPADAFAADITSGARRGNPALVTGKTLNVPAPGVFDANDTSVPSVPFGTDVVAYVLYRDTGSLGTSDLIAYMDGFFVAPNGGPVLIEHDDGPFRIFAL